MNVLIMVAETLKDLRKSMIKLVLRFWGKKLKAKKIPMSHQKDKKTSHMRRNMTTVQDGTDQTVTALDISNTSDAVYIKGKNLNKKGKMAIKSKGGRNGTQLWKTAIAGTAITKPMTLCADPIISILSEIIDRSLLAANLKPRSARVGPAPKI